MLGNSKDASSNGIWGSFGVENQSDDEDRHNVVVNGKSTEQGTCDASIRTFDLLGGKGTSNCPDSVWTISFIVKNLLF